MRPIGLALLTGQALATWSLALAGCAGERERGADDSEVLRTDSAGIEIVTNRRPPESIPGWSLELRLDIGADLGNPDQELFRAGDAATLSDGRIVVANSGTRELRYFSPSGALELTVGREGEGPGEFGSVASIDVTPGDSVFAADPRQRRISVFTAEGEFARDFSLEPPGEGGFPRYLSRFDNGSMLASLFEIISADELQDEQVYRRNMAYVLYAPDGAPGDTVGLLPTVPNFLRMQGTRGQVSAVSIERIPFETGGRWAAAPDGFALGTGDTYEIRLFSRGGSIRRIVRSTLERAPVTAELIDALLEERMAAIEDPAVRREARENFADLPLPDRLPAFEELSLDRAGRLWVRDPLRPRDRVTRWTVFDASGAMAARTELPARLTPFEIGEDYLLGHFVDELDVEHVQLHRLLGPSGG